MGMYFEDFEDAGEFETAGRLVTEDDVRAFAELSGDLLIGVGVNVNNSFDDAPEPLRAIGTSLVDQTGRVHELTDVLVAVVFDEAPLRAAMVASMSNPPPTKPHANGCGPRARRCRRRCAASRRDARFSSMTCSRSSTV